MQDVLDAHAVPLPPVECAGGGSCRVNRQCATPRGLLDLGMDPARFVLSDKQLEEHPCELICSVCLNVKCEPASGCAESHSFCQACIEDIVSSGRNASCPSCRGELRELRPDRIARNVIAQLDIRCVYCDQVHHVEQLQAHEEQCPRRPVSCGHEGCGVDRAAADLAEHEQTCLARIKATAASQTAEVASATQGNDRRQSGKRRDRAGHESPDTKRARTSSPLLHSGDDAFFSRSQLSQLLGGGQQGFCATKNGEVFYVAFHSGMNPMAASDGLFDIGSGETRRGWARSIATSAYPGKHPAIPLFTCDKTRCTKCGGRGGGPVWQYTNHVRARADGWVQFCTHTDDPCQRGTEGSCGPCAQVLARRAASANHLLRENSPVASFVQTDWAPQDAPNGYAASLRARLEQSTRGGSAAAEYSAVVSLDGAGATRARSETHSAGEFAAALAERLFDSVASGKTRQSLWMNNPSGSGRTRVGKIERSKIGGPGAVDLVCTLPGCVCAGFTTVPDSGQGDCSSQNRSGNVSRVPGVCSREEVHRLLQELRDRSAELLQSRKPSSTRLRLSTDTAPVEKGDRVNVKYDRWYKGTVLAVEDGGNGRKWLAHFDADGKKEWVDEEIHVWKKIPSMSGPKEV